LRSREDSPDERLGRSSQAAEQILGLMLAPERGGPRPDWSSVFEATHGAPVG
jgi:hypothetical protein